MRLLLFLLLALVATGSAQTPRPNIVVFLFDDHSVQDSSAFGAPDVRTPGMQRLARDGMTFTHAFVASPSFAQSRAALLTGLMPARNGAEANHSKARADLKALPAFFADLGYEVAAFGKVAHYNHNRHYGFTNEGFEGFHNQRGIGAAVDFLRGRDKTKPVCLFVGTNWPHVPWPEEADGYNPAEIRIPPTHVDTPETRAFRARYLTAVTRADEDLGMIYEAAQAHLGENTLFVMSSDHGAQWPFAKWTCYEAGVHVPLIVVWPGVTKPGARSQAMVSWVDILPTLVEAAGGKAPAPGSIDGRSFLEVLRGKKDAHRDRIFTTHSGDGKMNVYPSRGLRTQEWKYILNLHPEFQFGTHIDRANDVDGSHYWKSWERKAETDATAAAIVKRYRQRPREELYHLPSDPHEQRNLAGNAQHAERLKSMREEMQAWMQRQGDKGTVFSTPVRLSD